MNLNIEESCDSDGCSGWRAPDECPNKGQFDKDSLACRECERDAIEAMEGIDIFDGARGAKDILKELVDFIEENDIEDEGASDGGGHYDTWRSSEFNQLIEKAKEVIRRD